jgi:hypothetical protein
MRRRPLVLAFSFAILASPLAWAQMQMTSSSGPALESMAAGAGRYLTTRGLASGLKLGEDAILHAGVFADIGYDSNVFYSDNAQAAPVLHVTPRLELTNAERDGSIPSGTYYNLNVSLDWREYLVGDSSIPNIQAQNALNPSAGGTVEFSSGQALSLSLADAFSRDQQAPYTNGSPITRDDNMASASLRFAPGGGRLRVMLRYSNLIDNYEGSTYARGSNMGNEGVLDIGWRWLPKTSIYVQVAQGAITYVNGGTGISSFPLRTLLGLRGLLTGKLAVNIAAGYSNAFYSSGGSPSGVGVVTELNYNMSILSQAGIGYHHDFANSPFVGQYYNMDAVYGAYRQMIAGRVVTYAYGRYENRRFVGSGPTNSRTYLSNSRTDNTIIGGLSLDYMIGKFFLAGASYTLSLNRSSDTDQADATAGVDYAKHVLLFRVGVVY